LGDFGTPRLAGSTGQFSAMKERQEKSSNHGRACSGVGTLGTFTTTGRMPLSRAAVTEDSGLAAAAAGFCSALIL